MTIAQVLGQEGALDEKYEAFPAESTGWIMTKPTFYNHVLPLDITANKGQLISVSASPRSINGASVYFTPPQTACRPHPQPDGCRER